MIYECTMCGGDVLFNQGDSVGICDSCGRRTPVPHNSDDIKLKQFNRANRYRRIFFFFFSLASYEYILDQDDNNAEAHWGAFLSRHGIEYVEDEKTKKRTPTFHKMQMASVLADEDYLDAVKFAATPDAQKIYQERCKEIADIQKQIIEVSKSKEQQYDVFICYKERDGDERTQDSVNAENLYDYLTRKGYRVFFARKTLQLGVRYEPYIFSALQSARVMLVLGSKAEYFSAIWVKNEWSRYLDLMKDHSKNRTLIPCFWNLNPDDDLPVELAHLQAQNMCKVGAMQDLASGIAKILDDEKKPIVKPEPSGEVVKQERPVDRIMKNGDTFLRLGNYSSAVELYKKAAMEYPEDYRSWWGCIVSNTKMFSVVVDNVLQAKLDQWFSYVKKLTETKEKSAYEAMRGAYEQYLARVAARDSKQEEEAINGRISRIVNAINCNRNNVAELESKSIQNRAKAQNEIEEHRATIKQYEQHMKQIDKDLRKADRSAFVNKIRFFFWACLVVIEISFEIIYVGVIILLFGKYAGKVNLSDRAQALCFVLVAVGLPFIYYMYVRSWSPTKKAREARSDIKGYKNTINNLEERYRKTVENKNSINIAIFDLQTNSEAAIKANVERINELQSYEIGLQGWINSYNEYLKSGTSFNYFFCQRCNYVGIPKVVDDVTKAWHTRLEYLMNNEPR